MLRQLTELQKLADEAARLAIQSGPQGLRRALQAAQAFASVAQSQVAKLSSSNQTDRPEVILRMLFERLGATYIKLGQFIASSPTLFPEEYVLEFQKCLDEAPPVDFSVIRGIVEKELGDGPGGRVRKSVDPNTAGDGFHRAGARGGAAGQRQGGRDQGAQAGCRRTR